MTSESLALEPRPEPPRPDPDTLAGALRAYRDARGLSMRSASALAGASCWSWGKWESGVVPSPVFLRQLAGLLDRSPAEIRQLAGPDRVRGLGSVGDERSHPLARARVEAGLSAAEFARRLHISPSLVSKWEAGVKIPGRRSFPAIARVLGMDVATVRSLLGHRLAPGETVPVPSLRALRLRRRLSRAGLARLLGVAPRTVERWERLGLAPCRHLSALTAALSADVQALARPAVVQAPRPAAATQLQWFRERRQLSLPVVAARVGVSPASLRAWEARKSQPGWAQARALARVLKCPVADVFTAAGLERPRHLDASRWTAGQLPAILAELRCWQGWTQNDVAVITGVSVATVRAWEQGRHRPRAKSLSRLDDCLRTPVRLSDLPLQIPLETRPTRYVRAAANCALAAESTKRWVDLVRPAMLALIRLQVLGRPNLARCPCTISIGLISSVR